MIASSRHRAALRRSREIDCVIGPRPRPAQRAAVALGLAALVAAAAWMHGWRTAHDVLAPHSAIDPGAALRQQLVEADAALKMEQSRSRELERQIDALNKRLVESQEQLTFLRKSRGEKP